MNIDDELKAAGLLTVSEIMKGQPIDGFQRHTGVRDIKTFKEWLDLRVEEMLTMKARLTLDKKEDTELYEWVFSHCAAFNEVRINLNAALES